MYKVWAKPSLWRDCVNAGYGSVRSHYTLTVGCLRLKGVFLIYCEANWTLTTLEYCDVILPVIYSGQIRGLIKKARLLLAPLGLPAIICTLAACARWLLFNHCLACREGKGMTAAWFLPKQLRCLCTTPVGSQHLPLSSMMPLRTARDCRTEWMCPIHSHKFSAS